MLAEIVGVFFSVYISAAQEASDGAVVVAATGSSVRGSRRRRESRETDVGLETLCRRLYST